MSRDVREWREKLRMQRNVISRLSRNSKSRGTIHRMSWKFCKSLESTCRGKVEIIQRSVADLILKNDALSILQLRLQRFLYS